MVNEGYRLVVQDDPKSPAAEAIRTLRTNLQYLSLDKPIRSIMVTSAVPAEGKTTIASNLAIALADAGHQTLLVGADLRKPTAHKLFGGHSRFGITTILTGHTTLEESLQSTFHPNLKLLAAGPVPPNPAEMLGSQAMRSLMDQLKEIADFIICDGAPVLAVTDSSLLARAVDGTLLVVHMGHTPREAARQAKEQLEKVNATILGVVANRIDITRGGSYYYYYYYGTDEKSAAAYNPKSSKVGERRLARLFGGE